MVDIITDFASVDDDWHYLALVEDARPGLDLQPGTRAVAGTGNDRWTVEITDIHDGLIRFKLIEPAPAPSHTRSQPRAAG